LPTGYKSDLTAIFLFFEKEELQHAAASLAILDSFFKWHREKTG
jgi:hypothetical protein